MEGFYRSLQPPGELRYVRCLVACCRIAVGLAQHGAVENPLWKHLHLWPRPKMQTVQACHASPLQAVPKVDAPGSVHGQEHVNKLELTAHSKVSKSYAEGTSEMLTNLEFSTLTNSAFEFSFK
eukprot:SAG31_NODE_1347_length_8693_cov_32.744938_7_plen_123_part_00